MPAVTAFFLFALFYFSFFFLFSSFFFFFPIQKYLLLRGRGVGERWGRCEGVRSVFCDQGGKRPSYLEFQWLRSSPKYRHPSVLRSSIFFLIVRLYII